VFILVNGAFGIGKTTVARRLCALLPRALLFDPEWIGFVLKRLPGYDASDFQHLAAWRRSAMLGARAFGLVAPTVVVPMAFSEPAYLDAVRSGIAASRRPVRHFCLIAPIDVVTARLEDRGEPADDPRWAWVHRRAAECCAAHASRTFAEHVPATGTPEEIAADLVARLGG